MENIIIILGCVLLWAATDVGRNKNNRVKFMRDKWWIIFILITSGTYIILNAHKLFI